MIRTRSRTRARVRACLLGLTATAVLGSPLLPGLAAAETPPADTSPADTSPADTAATAPRLAAPTGLAPDDSALRAARQVRKEVTLSWRPVAGAVGYRVQVGTDESWSDDPTYTADTVATRFTLPVWLPHASYVWRVAALRGTRAGHWSSEAGSSQPKAEFLRGWRAAPTPVSPATAVAGRPTFRWTPVAAASGYEVQISSSPTFPRGVTVTGPSATPGTGTRVQAGLGTDTCFTARTQVTPFTTQADHGVQAPGACYFTVLGTGATRYWRVRALDRFVDTASQVDTTPATDAGISHLPPSSKPNDPDISATCPGNGAAAPTPAPATPSPGASASPTPSPAPSGGGESEAKGCEPTHPVEAGAWSATVPFSATYTPPTVALDHDALVSTRPVTEDPDRLCTAVSGAADQAVCRDFPTITWDPVPGASRYRLYVGLDEEFSNIQSIDETSGTSWTPTAAWRDSSPFGSYYYVVQACDTTGCGEVTSTPPSFRKLTPRLLPGTRPSPNADPVLHWQSLSAALSAATGAPATADAYAYHVQVTTAADEAFDAKPIIDATVDATSYVSPKVRLPEGDLLWRVQPVDSSDHRLPWSQPQAFLRDTVPPRVVSASPATGLGLTGAVRVRFSEPVTGVTASSLTLGSAPTTVRVLDARTALLVPTRLLSTGATYRVQVAPGVRDLVGNPAVADGPLVHVIVVADDRSPAVSYGGRWSVLTSTDATGRTSHRSAPVPGSPTSASLPFTGRAVTVLACVGPGNGYLDVYLDGRYAGRADTFRGYSACSVPVRTVSGVRGTHVVQVRGIGAHDGAARGSAVALDAFRVTP